MDREKFYCERCGKELVNGGCLSQIDHKLICIYCDNKEQPKELMKRIVYLEAKLAESKQETNDWKQRFESSEERFKTFNSNGATALNLKNEKIAQLKQQLAEKEQQILALQEESIRDNQIYNCELAEKEKEIEDLNHKLNVEEPCLLMNYKDMVDMLKQSQNQTAIDELEKLKEYIRSDYRIGRSDVFCKIYQRIKELKGDR